MVFLARVVTLQAEHNWCGCVRTLHTSKSASCPKAPDCCMVGLRDDFSPTMQQSGALGQLADLVCKVLTQPLWLGQSVTAVQPCS